MKILFLTRRFYPDVGGVEKHVYKISEQLIRNGHQVIVITESPSGLKHAKEKNYHSPSNSARGAMFLKQPVKSSQFEHFDTKKVSIIRLRVGKNSHNKKFKIWAQLHQHFNLFKEADVIHCHDVFFWYLPFRFLLPFKKVFVTFHGYESYPLPKKNIFLHKVWEKLSTGNIIVGKFIQKWYGTSPDYIIYGGADSIVQKKVKKRVPTSAYFVGRLDEQTNIQDYLQAVRLVREKHKNFKFIVAGDGKYKRIAEKEGRVLGFISKPEANFKKYRYAFISRYLAMLEAMQSKILVFAVFDNPIKKDYLKLSPFSKFAVIASSPEELSQKVLYFMQNPADEKRIVENAYDWAKNQTWEKVTNTYLKLWQKA